MINQNNPKTHLSINISITNKRVQQFAHVDLKRILHKKKNLNLNILNDSYISNTASSQESTFRDKFNDGNKTINQIIEEVYQLKKQDVLSNFSSNSGKILPYCYNQEKQEKLFQQKYEPKIRYRNSISRTHLTKNDDSILNNTNNESKTLSFVQPNHIKIYQKQNDQLKTSHKVILKSKQPQILILNKISEQSIRFPFIQQQLQSKLNPNEKLKANQYLLKLNEQFKQLKDDKVLEPFLKDQKLKPKFMTPLVIRKDKPYFVAENKDNKYLIDNMKNEDKNSSKDEYFIVSHEKILDYI